MPTMETHRPGLTTKARAGRKAPGVGMEGESRRSTWVSGNSSGLAPINLRFPQSFNP